MEVIQGHMDMTANVQKIYSDSEVLEHLNILFNEFQKTIKTPLTRDNLKSLFSSKYGTLLRQKSTIIYSEKGFKSKRELCQRIEKLLPLELASLQSLNQDLPNIIATAAEEDHDFDQLKKAFRDYLETLVSNSIFDVYLPNNLFSLQGVSKIEVGPVEIVNGVDVSSILNLKLTEIAETQSGAERGSTIFDGKELTATYGDDTDFNIKIPSGPTMWKITVAAHTLNANEEALWKIKVACGLIRILGQTWNGPNPHDNRLERHPTIHDKYMGESSLKIKDTGVSFGGGEIYFQFKLDRTLKSEIESTRSKSIIANIMEHNSKSVGERVYLALAWISTARHTQDKSERLLATMTALEAIFTRGKDAPVNETIARLDSVVIAKTIKDREPIAKEFKSLYNHRSKIIHNGHRSATETTTKKALFIAELVVERILQEVELKAKADKFITELVTASYGSEWPIKP